LRHCPDRADSHTGKAVDAFCVVNFDDYVVQGYARNRANPGAAAAIAALVAVIFNHF
jgi:hypothetical protein